MPEYIINIKQGVSFEDWCMLCARAFGRMDLPITAPIPESFTPSPYHRDKLANAKKKLVKIRKTTLHQADCEARKLYHKELEHMKENIAQNELYKSMLEQVKQWKPPTLNHEGLKKFMQEQIESFIWDSTFYKYKIARIKLMTGQEWKTKKIKMYQDDIKYYKKEWDAEVKRAKERTNWIRKLRNNLYGKPLHGTKIDFDRITKASGQLAKKMVPLFKMGN